MTLKASILFVLAGDRKVGLRIVIESKVLLPTQVHVATFAGLQGSLEAIGSLTDKAVIISVAAIAGFFEACPAELTHAFARSRRRLLMTVDTVDLRVLPAKVESGHRMIKIGQFPTSLTMTGRALAASKAGAQLVPVLVLVTTEALGRFELRPVVFEIVLPFRDVALVALDLGMSSDEGIARFALVIESLSILPICRVVTATAFFVLEFSFKEVNVIRLVAGVARIHGSEKARFLRANRFALALIRVAFSTISLDVSSVEFKARLRVIESLLIERKRIEIPTFVISVTLAAGSTLHESMKMLFLFDMPTNFLVTVGAQLIGNTPSRLVTFKTIFVFKIFVTDDQRSRC